MHSCGTVAPRRPHSLGVRFLMTSDIHIQIGVDSQCLSYLIDAMAGVSEPNDSLACERKALLRLYLYLPGTLYVTPTILTECAQIQQTDRRELHARFCNVLFDEVTVTKENEVQSLVDKYSANHSGVNDCRILAEAVHGGLGALATYDGDFISHLRSKEKALVLDRPSTIWESMNIPRGATPDKQPHHTNPLSKEEWWKW